MPRPFLGGAPAFPDKPRARRKNCKRGVSYVRSPIYGASRRCGAVALARQPHKLEVAGSSPVTAPDGSEAKRWWVEVLFNHEDACEGHVQAISLADLTCWGFRTEFRSFYGGESDALFGAWGADL